MAIELSNLTFTDQADVVPFSGVEEILNTGVANTLAGDDIITGIGLYGISILPFATLISGGGNDTITGISTGNIVTSGTGIVNNGLIETGDGDDVITGTTAQGYGIVNGGIISTGNGNDLIIGIGDISRNDIYNYGIINTGNGDDSIIASGSFRSGFDNQGSVFLGNGKDYFKGFGSGNFNGGNGKDTLELTSGSYTVGISGTTVNFTKGDSIMITSEFEKLIAGNTIYNFASLTAGQTIVVA